MALKADLNGLHGACARVRTFRDHFSHKLSNIPGILRSTFVRNSSNVAGLIVLMCM